MARRRPWCTHVVSLYWRTRHLLLRFLCLHEAAILPFGVLRFSGPKIPYFRHRLSICTSATAYSGTLFSLWWSAMEYRRCQPPFFGDLHQEISRSWKQPFSSHLINAAAADFTNLVGSVEQGYTAMPVVEDTLASHLSPSLAPSWKSRPLLPTKPCRTTSALIGKSYIAAGQAGMALHTMAILQAYQADVLKEMDEGTGLTPEAVKELRRATDLALRANKHTARAVGRSMAGSVAAERRLWLNLTEIREREVFLLDAPISQSGLFGEAVSSVVEKFRSAKTQSAALKQFMPRRTRDHSTPSSSLSREQSLPRKEPSGRSGAQAAHPPPTMVWGARGRSFPRQRPRRRVDLKRPNRPATSAPPSRSWPSGRNEESRLTATRRDQTAKAYLPASNAFSSLKSVTTTPRGLVCRMSSPSFFLGLAVGGHVRLSPSTVRPFATCQGTQSVLSCSVRTPCRPPVSPALHSPSTQTRTPRAFLRGGGRHCFQAFSTPHLRYVFLCTTLCFLYRISFTNGSVYRGYRFGFSAQFGPATHFSLGEIPPASTEFSWQ